MAIAEIDLFDIQKDILLGKTTVTAPTGTQEADIARIVALLKNAEDITLDLSGTGIKAIPDSAFEWCGALKAVILPKGLTSIGKWAFSYCYSLTSIVIPEGVASIGDWTFYWCESLTFVSRFLKASRVLGMVR